MGSLDGSNGSLYPCCRMTPICGSSSSSSNSFTFLVAAGDSWLLWASTHPYSYRVATCRGGNE